MATAPKGDPRDALAHSLICSDVKILAPKLEEIAVCETRFLNLSGYDAVIYETGRSDELAKLYFAMKRSHACDAMHTQHGVRLAFDVISKSRGWAVWPEWSEALGKYVGGDPEWYEPVVAAYKGRGLHWGGDWNSIKDCPHFQWNCEGMHESPRDHARALFAAGGYEAVWKNVGAM